MPALTVQTISRTGVEMAAKVAANAGGDTFTNDGKTFLSVANASGGPLTVTVDATKNCDQGFDHNVAVAVPDAATDYLIGPFPKAIFGGTANISYSGGVTSLTIQAIAGGV